MSQHYLMPPDLIGFVVMPDKNEVVIFNFSVNVQEPCYEALIQMM